MNLKEIIEGLIEYDSATAQNALMTMDEYDNCLLYTSDAADE